MYTLEDALKAEDGKGDQLNYEKKNQKLETDETGY